MLTETMTPRERWLAALDSKPLDRLPFWPKINGSYAACQAEPFRSMGLDALHEWIGSDRHDSCGGCVRHVRRKTSSKSQHDGNLTTEQYVTPSGTLERVTRSDEVSQSSHPVVFPVKTVQDVEILTGWFDDIACELDEKSLKASQDQCRAIGEDAVIATSIGESPLMQWVEWLAGVENAHFLLADHTPQVEALFEVMHRSLRETAKILLANSPADMFYMVENTSTTLISPQQYRTYCLKHVGEYARIARANGKRLVLHMCGHLKDILPDLATLGATAFEAFTTPTVGNTTLLDGRTACPDVCLIGGTSAALWLEPAETIIAHLQADLACLPHHRGLVITSAGVMPPAASPEKIKAVCDWVKGFDLRL